MALDFITKDVIHRIAVKFTHAFLPVAKKPYNLKTVHQPELDIHEIASKAEIYNITTPPRIIEEGLSAGIELILYLAADGYKIKTPLFNLRVRVPGEYDGGETHLPTGVHPEPSLQAGAALRQYIRSHVQIEFDGFDQSDGFIAQALDETTVQIDEVMTIGGILTIHGTGLKIEADQAHEEAAGLYFEDEQGVRVKAGTIAVNEPKTLKVVVPAGLAAGTAYRLTTVTQSSAKHSGTLLKNPRETRSEFTLTAQSAQE